MLATLLSSLSNARESEKERYRKLLSHVCCKVNVVALRNDVSSPNRFTENQQQQQGSSSLSQTLVPTQENDEEEQQEDTNNNSSSTHQNTEGSAEANTTIRNDSQQSTFSNPQSEPFTNNRTNAESSNNNNNTNTTRQRAQSLRERIQSHLREEDQDEYDFVDVNEVAGESNENENETTGDDGGEGANNNNNETPPDDDMDPELKARKFEVQGYLVFVDNKNITLLDTCPPDSKDFALKMKSLLPEHQHLLREIPMCSTIKIESIVSITVAKEENETETNSNNQRRSKKTKNGRVKNSSLKKETRPDHLSRLLKTDLSGDVLCQAITLRFVWEKLCLAKPTTNNNDNSNDNKKKTNQQQQPDSATTATTDNDHPADHRREGRLFENDDDSGEEEDDEFADFDSDDHEIAEWLGIRQEMEQARRHRLRRNRRRRQRRNHQARRIRQNNHNNDDDDDAVESDEWSDEITDEDVTTTDDTEDEQAVANRRRARARRNNNRSSRNTSASNNNNNTTTSSSPRSRRREEQLNARNLADCDILNALPSSRNHAIVNAANGGEQRDEREPNLVEIIRPRFHLLQQFAGEQLVLMKLADEESEAMATFAVLEHAGRKKSAANTSTNNNNNLIPVVVSSEKEKENEPSVTTTSNNDKTDESKKQQQQPVANDDENDFGFNTCVEQARLLRKLNEQVLEGRTATAGSTFGGLFGSRSAAAARVNFFDVDDDQLLRDMLRNRFRRRNNNNNSDDSSDNGISNFFRTARQRFLQGPMLSLFRVRLGIWVFMAIIFAVACGLYYWKAIVNFKSSDTDPENRFIVDLSILLLMPGTASGILSVGILHNCLQVFTGTDRNLPRFDRYKLLRFLVTLSAIITMITVGLKWQSATELTGLDGVISALASKDNSSMCDFQVEYNCSGSSAICDPRSFWFGNSTFECPSNCNYQETIFAQYEGDTNLWWSPVQSCAQFVRELVYVELIFLISLSGAVFLLNITWGVAEGTCFAIFNGG